MSSKQSGVLPQEIETRHFREFRVQRDEHDGVTIEGHAATFNDPYKIADFEEQVAPGAFRDEVDNPDVLALWNHDPSHVLGSVKGGTLRMEEDEVGLHSEVDLPKSREDVRESIERGDVDKMSFGFRVVEESWKARDDEPDLRTIEKVELFDVSPVAFPANDQTDLSVKADAGVQAHREFRSKLEAEEETEEAEEGTLEDLASRLEAVTEERDELLAEVEELREKIESQEPPEESEQEEDSPDSDTALSLAKAKLRLMREDRELEVVS